MEENKIINFSELKRKEIRKSFGNLEKPIEVYNPNPEKRKEIEKILYKSFSKDKKEINVSGENILLDLLPLCTNIILDIDRNDKEMINSILNDPDPTFEDVIWEVQQVIKEIGGRYVNTIKALIELPKEELDKLIKENSPELEAKEKKKEELIKQQLELKNQLEKLEKEEQ